MTRFKTSAIFVGISLTAWFLWSMASLAKTPESAENNAEQNNPDALVAKGASFQISLDEYVDIATSQSPSAQAELIDSSEKREQLLEKLINMNLLAAEAKRRGYDVNPEVITVKKNRLATLMHAKIARQIEEEPPSESALREFYDANYAKYNKPEKIRARHILITDRKRAQELLNQMKKDNIGQYAFRKLAREESEDEKTANRGGDLDFFTRDDTGQELDSKLIEAAYRIPANGELYPQLVETEAGFHIIMRTGYRQKIDMKYEDAKERITKTVQRNLHRQKVDDAMAELQKRYPVQLFEENLKHVVIDLTKPANGHGAPISKKDVIRP